MTTVASFVGGTIGIILMMLFAPTIAAYALSFGSADYFALMVLGLVAASTISDEELQRALFEQVRQYPGQEQQVYDYFRKTPEAIQSLRAPIYEEKVVDHLLGSVKVTDKTVSREELMKEDEEETSAAA